MTIDVDELAARLPDEERLRIAKSLVAAAYALCPKDHGGAYPDPASLELVNFMLGGIDLLLETLREKRLFLSQISSGRNNGAIRL